MQNSKYLIIVTVALLSLFTKGLLAQDNVPIATLTIGSSANGLSLAERLGYASDTKLLIVHADDIGFSHSANTATMRAFELGPVKTGAIMVPVPWFQEIAALVQQQSDQQQAQFDFGVHITLTSEWKYFKWNGVLAASEIPSLINEDGYFYTNGAEVAEHAVAEEADREARAQIERAMAYGIEPTHLDVHNSALWGTAELFQVYLELGRDYKLPILISSDGIAKVKPDYQSMLSEDDIVLDRVIMMARDALVENWVPEYEKLFASVEPGVTQLIIHFGFDDTELRAMAVDRPNPNAAWRQSDFDFFTSAEFKSLLDRNNIQLITWREIRDLLRS